ncbi:MAG: LegC family aminotransferase [Alphaproteobacteria bacterium]|jgi:perosamine synthetase|nr:LegC family aminotransferase [Alphaproteobacteria bacterium]MBT7942772.1 LegC family aminotransferase [Alphaproteobacteria bacterium]
MTLEPNAIVETLATILTGRAGLHEPEFAGNEWEYVKDCLDTGWVSTAGKYVETFEEKLVAFTGAKHAIACVNGTAALHACFLLAGVKAGDEVIMPALTFVGTANAAAGMGAVPHFVDVEERTLGLDAAKLDAHLSDVAEVTDDGLRNRKTGRRIAACVPVHTFGHPVDLDPLLAVCRKFELVLIEDAAESLGSYYNNRHTGNHGLLAMLSFNGNKTVTTGGGGAILTNDSEVAARARHLTTTAKMAHPWEYRHDQIGFNYRLPNINAALGCAQMEQLPRFLKQKRRLAQTYAEAFADVEGLRFFTEPDFAKSNYWLNVLLLDPQTAGQRDAILEATNDSKFMTRPAWTPLHDLPMYKDCPRMDLSVAEGLITRIINIPSSPGLAVAND